MAPMPSGRTPELCSTRRVAPARAAHQSEGCCSAQPGRTAMISISASGKNEEARHRPVRASRMLAFAEELPRS